MSSRLKNEPKITRIAQSIRRDGGLETWWKVLHRIRVLSVRHTFLVYGKTLTGPEPSSQGVKVPFLQYREIHRDDLRRMRLAEGVGPAGNLIAHFDSGYRIFAACFGDEIVSINGMHMEKIFLTYVRIPEIELPSGYSYLNLAFTAPAWRGWEIGSELRKMILNQMFEEGIGQVLLVTHLENTGARRWQERAGFERLGAITYLKWKNKEEQWVRLHRNADAYPEAVNMLLGLENNKEGAPGRTFAGKVS